MRITVQATPRAKQNKIIVISPTELKAYTTAIPEDGEATKKVVALLAAHYKIAKQRITLVRGATSRTKLFEIDL